MIQHDEYGLVGPRHLLKAWGEREGERERGGRGGRERERMI